LAEGNPAYTVALGVDVGERHVGLARAFAGVAAVLPAGSITVTTAEKAAGSVVDRVQVDGVDLVVIGLPLGLDGQDTLQTRRVRRFAGFVRKQLAARGLHRSVRVEFADERLSSVAVARAMVSQGQSPARSRDTKDELEAAYVLQGYIDCLASRRPDAEPGPG
jgi:putative Holliday junction resolvase